MMSSARGTSRLFACVVVLCVGVAFRCPLSAVSISAVRAGPPQQQPTTATPPSDVKDTLAAARALISEGKPKDAIAKLQTLDANIPEVGHMLGVAYYHADDHRAAIAQLRAVRDRLPADSVERRETVQILGLCYYLTGRFADAIPLLEETREWAANNLELGYILGMAYIQTRQPDAARASLARTFQVQPDSAAAHLLAAQMMIRLEMEALAETELKRALEKDPKIPRAHYLLGQMALFRGKLDEAVALSEQELAINPGDAMALFQIGDAHLRASRVDEAIAALQKSLWLNPFYSGPYVLLGRAYMKKGQPATAEGMLRQGIQYDPNNRSAHYQLAQLLQQMGRAEEAKREFEIAERLQSSGK
jgi:tetratricopeptide (TPR) repeat protein